MGSIATLVLEITGVAFALMAVAVPLLCVAAWIAFHAWRWIKDEWERLFGQKTSPLKF